MSIKFSNLKRQLQVMPLFVKEVLNDNNLMHDYRTRPAYQQNDYLGWINQARLELTKQKRLEQMLAELKQGGVYMKMSHPASSKN